MIKIKTEEEIVAMRRAGRVTADVLQVVCAAVIAGISTGELDKMVGEELRLRGARSACLGYGGSKCPFPANACISVNDEVVHGIPSDGRTVCDGDIVSIDLVAIVDGFMGDSTITVAVGEVDDEVAKLLKVTEEALHAGIAAARSGNRIGDISAAIEKKAVDAGLGVVRELVGHGIGREMHEEPPIPNWGPEKSGPLLVPGMTLAIEPMFMLGREELIFCDDGWTVLTADGRPAAHFEHTILVTKNDPEVLTAPEKCFRRQVTCVKDCG
ncbi:MAG: type I methionyl aminopeptidase [Puniceicoccales bacterium]|jgi:methionyl aminopeptidase|nr:type I methionyl aminopeptidase [Puniceicoccales bacterium]